MSAAAPARGGLPWWTAIAFAIAVHLVILQQAWFDAPIWDDYDSILAMLVAAAEPRSWSEWPAFLFAQHNEHRIAVTRVVAIALAGLGEIDFRVLMLPGLLALLGIFALICSEFRQRVSPAALGASAFLMFQWSYFEGSLMVTSGLPQFGVIFFAFACLYCAMRDGARAAWVSGVAGILAALSLANGLLALPIAAVACAVWGRRRRAVVFALIALLAWGLYLNGFTRPGNHPSALGALTSPFHAFAMFLLLIGSFVPGTKGAIAAGAVMLGGFAWLARLRFWKTHPVATLWIAFLLASWAVVAAGRFALGIQWQSRYAIGSTCLLVILCLGIFSMRPRIWLRPMVLVGLAAAVSALVSIGSWPYVRERALTGRLLKETVPKAGVSVERFGGAYYPNPERASRTLASSVERGIYAPPKIAIHPWNVVLGAPPRANLPAAGFLDEIEVAGPRAVLRGWTGIPATVPQRTLRVTSATAIRNAGPVAVVARPDVAHALRDENALFSGFRMEVEFLSEAEAARGAQALCVVAEAPGRPATRLAGKAICP